MFVQFMRMTDPGNGVQAHLARIFHVNPAHVTRVIAHAQSGTIIYTSDGATERVAETPSEVLDRLSGKAQKI
jgi:hypothetical protein